MLLSPAISVVLVESQGGRNLGAIARVMKNFGVADLRLVRPRVGHRSPEACRMAVRSVEILEQAALFESLPAALADCHLAVGTTRRFGRYRDNLLLPAEAAAMVATLPMGQRAALVFGREDKGLTTEELDCCQRLLTIPADVALPSLNVAQAVGICLYEVAKAAGGGENPSPAREDPATGAEYERLYDQMRQTLLAIGFLDPRNPGHIMRAMRRLLGRQGMTSREVRLLRGLLSQVDWLEREGRAARQPGRKQG